MVARRRVGGGAAGSPLAGERIPREGECAAVERFHHGALSLCPLHRPMAEVRRAVDSLSFHVSVKKTPTVVIPAAEVGPTVGPSPPGPLHLCFSDLGLGFRFCTVKSIRDRFLCSFLFPNTIHYLARLWYH
jgi:hypothetical protein